MRGEHAHEASEHHELDATLVEQPMQLVLEGLACGERLVIDDKLRLARLTRPRECRRLGAIRDHSHDLAGRERAARFRVEQRLQIRSAAADEDCDFHAAYRDGSPPPRGTSLPTTRARTLVSSCTVCAAVSAGTTMIMPRPMLNVRRIS